MADIKGAGIDPTGLKNVLKNQINPATAELQQTMNDTLSGIAGFVPSQYDTIQVNYTTSDKTILSSVIYKLGATTIATITVTYPSGASEVYTKT